jgi:hypothetical protein
MPVFRCEAMGSTGEEEASQLSAASAEEAMRLFRAKGLFVTRVVEVSGSGGEARPGGTTKPATEDGTTPKAHSLSDDQPPPGSQIESRLNGTELVLAIPPSSAVYQGPFSFIALAYVGMLAVITLFAAVVGFEPGEARFFVPILVFLWAIGLGIFSIWLRGRFGWTHVSVEPGRLVRRFSLFGWERVREYSLNGDSTVSLVADISLQYGGLASVIWWGSKPGRPIYHVHVTTTDQPAKFGSYLSDDEKKWLVGRINRHLGRS